MSLLAAIDLQRLADGRFRWEVPDGWQQGRGAWGGLVSAGVGRAIELAEPESTRTLRTLSVHMPGPLGVGPALVSVEPLRIGSGMSTWTIVVTDLATGEPYAHAVGITGAARVPALACDMLTWGTAQPPELPPWEELPILPSSTPGLPRFMQFLELRVAEGLPLAGGVARCAGYARLTDQGTWDAAQLMGMVDAWFPTALLAVDRLRPMATVTYAAHLLVDPATIPAEEPLAFESTMSAAHEGFTSEIRRLWTLDGRLAVENHQSIVIVK